MLKNGQRHRLSLLVGAVASVIVLPIGAVAASAAQPRPAERVEVAPLGTESAQVFANPDGTYTLEQHAQPFRVRRAGGWVPIDPTLRRAADGSLEPAAVAVGLRISAGGNGPLVSISDGGRQLSLSWPAPLPAPIVAGATATYPEVLPGVDLAVTASATGFSEVLVVKSAQAARNPALATIRFTTHTIGVRLDVDPTGAVHVVDAAGNAVFEAPPSRMWDSSGRAGPDGTPPNRLVNAGLGARQARMAIRADAGGLSVVPDAAMLADPGLRYPVYLDPSFTGGKFAWAEVWLEIPNSADWNPSHEAMVGYENDPCCLPASTVRAFFRMNNTGVNGKHVLSAVFRMHEWWAWSCSARPVELWWTGSISSTTTWNHQPTWIQKLGSINTAKRRNDSRCPEGGVEFNITSLVQTAAAQRWPDMTLGVRAASETDPYGWKKFDNNPVVVVNYNTVPNAPTNMGTSPSTPCYSGAESGRPVISTTTPTLQATVSDADSGQLVKAAFWLEHTGGGLINTYVTAAAPSGSPHQITVPAGLLADGGSYSWKVRADDGIDVGSWGPWCEFIVDQTPPAVQPTVSSTTYPENDFGGGVGIPGDFTFDANGVADVVAYVYGLNVDPPSTEVAATSLGGTATVTLTPTLEGPNVLLVRSRDRAGNLGPVRLYEFFVFPA